MTAAARATLAQCITESLELITPPSAPRRVVATAPSHFNDTRKTRFGGCPRSFSDLEAREQPLRIGAQKLLLELLVQLEAGQFVTSKAYSSIDAAGP